MICSYVIYSMQKTPTGSPSGTPSAKKKPVTKFSGQFDHNGDDDTSHFVFGPQSKPSTVKSSEPAKVNTYTSYVCIHTNMQTFSVII